MMCDINVWMFRLISPATLSVLFFKANAENTWIGNEVDEVSL